MFVQKCPANKYVIKKSSWHNLVNVHNIRFCLCSLSVYVLQITNKYTNIISELGGYCWVSVSIEECCIHLQSWWYVCQPHTSLFLGPLLPHIPAVSSFVQFPAIYAVSLGLPLGYFNDPTICNTSFLIVRRGLRRGSTFTDTDGTHNNYH